MAADAAGRGSVEVIEGERARLRTVRVEDLPQIVAWQNDPETTRFMGGPMGTTVEGEWSRLLADEEAGERTTWAIEDLADQRLIGVIGLHTIIRHHYRARIFLLLGRIADRGRGYGTDALRCLLSWAFTSGGLHRVSMRVLPENAALLRCAEKCGFQREGVSRESWFADGQFHDDVRLAILEQDWRGPVAPD